MEKTKKQLIASFASRTFFVFVGFLFFLFIVLNTFQIFNLFTTSNSIKNNVYLLKDQINKKDIKNSYNTIEKLNTEAVNLSNNINKIVLIDKIPFISQNINSIKDLSELIKLATDSAIKIYPVINNNSDIFMNLDKTKIITMPESQKIKILSDIYNINSDLKIVETNINTIINLVNKNINNKYLVGPLKNVWNEINSKRDSILEVQAIIPLIKNLPDLLGTPHQSKYLLLFQNNTELRPTGGFIGSYGTLYIKNGNISSVVTNNVYNLDNPVIGKLKNTPPWQIREFLGKNTLYFRDANWNPDFAQSAEYLQTLYQKESGNKYPITATIAITPSVLSNVIGYFGDITVMGSTFNKENAVDLLNYETKFAYWETRGISENQRKIIIQKLADALFSKIKSLSFLQLKELIDIVLNDLENKQILIYSNNEDVQSFISKKNWGGEMKNIENSDYFSVVDANMSSGKSDKYIDRNINYDLRYSGSDLMATLSVTYNYRYDDYVKNEIYQDDLSYVQLYKTYTRVYVPEGAELISLYVNDEIVNRRDIEIKNENGKTYFGTYITIPTNEIYTYRFEYKIPKELEQKLNEKYVLSYQKQAGIDYNKINININLNKPILSYTISDNKKLSLNSYNNSFNVNGVADSDRDFEINFYNGLGDFTKAIKRNYLSFNKEKILGN